MNEHEDLIAEARILIADCRTYNFGLRNADRLAHEIAPRLADALEVLTTELERERSRGAARQRFVAETARHNEPLLAERDAEVAARTATILSQLFPDTEGDVGVKPAAVRKWLGFRAAEIREGK